MNQVKENLKEEVEKLQKNIAESINLLKTSQDEDLKKLAREEVKSIESQVTELEKSLQALNNDFNNSVEEEPGTGVTIDPNSIILEIRAGTGGDEAGIFAADLYRMYQRFSENKGYQTKEYFISENPSGGIKTTTMGIKGRNIFSLLKNESGVHRVQRVPVTESSGRIHTSTATVAVLPEVKKIDLELKPEDLKWDFFRSGGKGGQNVNKVSTAVRLTHLPTQIAIECQEERSQFKNREKALQMLHSRLYSAMKEQQVKSITDLRSSQVGTGERAEKIRTYNFPQDRLTDHRIKKSWHNLEEILNGNIDQVLDEVNNSINKNKSSKFSENPE